MLTPRNLQWERCAFIPRVLVLNQKLAENAEDEDGNTYLIKVESWSKNPSPIILRICPESRNAVLKANSYELVFGTRIYEPPIIDANLIGYYPRIYNTFVSHPVVHYNIYVDTVYISGTYCDSIKKAFSTYHHHGLLMRSVAVDFCVLFDEMDLHEGLLSIFHHHPIEDFIVMVR
jgi:hypothetical protein